MKQNLVSKMLLLLIGVTLFNSCKKNEDDPLISFRSRKTRVAGDWIAESGTVKYGPDSNTTVMTVKGKTFTAANACCAWEGTASVGFSFDKKGNANSRVVLHDYVNNWTGSWNFSDGVGEQKAKDQILVTTTTYDTGYGNNIVNGNQIVYTYDIDELRHKKMRIQFSFKITRTDGTVDYWHESWTLIPK